LRSAAQRGEADRPRHGSLALQWCGHCKRLAPEYAKAAGTLKAKGLRIAKVDATANDELAQRFKIQGFPTLKFFKGGNPTEYGGGRNADAIVSWVVKRSGPAFETLTSADEATAFKAKADVTVVGFFAKQEGALFKAFSSAADSIDDVVFAVAGDASARSALGVEGSGDAVVLFKSFDEGRVDFDGAATSDAVSGFVRDNSLPLVVKFSSETAPKIFGGSVKTHVLIMADGDMDGFEELHKSWAGEAAKQRGKAIFIWVPPTEDRILSYFDVTSADLPTAVVVRMPEDSAMKKFLYPHGKDVAAAKIGAFVASVLAGDVKPTLKSEEPEAADLTSPVKVVRGKSFGDIVLEPTKDVLLEFYAPWCGHCKALAPAYEELAEKLSGSENLVIAKMDATANEVDYEGLNVRGFPTLYFFPASKDGSPKVPVEFDGSRDVDGFVSFLQKNAVNPVVVADDDSVKDEL
jgi:protein disulfide-isomerase A1